MILPNFTVWTDTAAFPGTDSHWTQSKWLSQDNHRTQRNCTASCQQYRRSLYSMCSSLSLLLYFTVDNLSLITNFQPSLQGFTQSLAICFGLAEKVWHTGGSEISRNIEDTPCTYCIAGYFSGVLIFVIFVVYLGVTKFFPHCVAPSTRAQIWTRDILLSLFLLLASHWQCPWYTGSLFSSCLTCDGWVCEQRRVESRSTTNRKQGQYLSSNMEEPDITANGSAQLLFSHWHSSCSPVLSSQMSL